MVANKGPTEGWKTGIDGKKTASTPLTLTPVNFVKMIRSSFTLPWDKGRRLIFINPGLNRLESVTTQPGRTLCELLNISHYALGFGSIHVPSRILKISFEK